MKAKRMFTRLLALTMAFSMLVSLTVPANAVTATESGIAFEKVDSSQKPASLSNREVKEAAEAETEPEYADTDVVRVSILLDAPSTIEAGYSTEEIAANDSAMDYRDELLSQQDEVTEAIERAIGDELDVVWNLALAGNLISAYVEYGQIQEIEALDGVSGVVLETSYEAAVADTAEVADPQMSTSSAMIGSTAAYLEGYTGAGTRIAIIDTGTDDDHQSFDAGAYEYALQVLAEKAGMDYNEYVDSLNLLTAGEIASVAEYLNASRDVGFDAGKTYLSSKLPYAYNYVDDNYNINHDNDTQGEHGSHVAGIAAANSYIPNGDGTYSSALDTVLTQGVAPEAQIITMKVFGEGGGAYDSDMLAAIEDAIILGCDAVNLSIATANPGFATAPYQLMLDGVINSDTVICFSAGNYGAWPEYSDNYSTWAYGDGYGYLYGDDVSMQTDGSFGSYTNALTVASAENTGFTGTYIKAGDSLILYTEPSTPAGAQALTTVAGEHEYILIDGYGEPWEFEALADVLEGKVAVCQRGAGESNLYFYQKAEYAVQNGAIATIIYNNQSGTNLMDLTGYTQTAPCVSITQADGDVLRQAATPVYDGEDNVLYYEGTLTISETVAPVNYDVEYYTMSDYSSWGIPGSLELKPEITAPGGNIYSVNGGVEGGTAYKTLSGTSMASPQMAGMAALVAQYIKANGLKETTGLSSRALAQSLLMSTAQPIREEESGGNYYSILQQGAGLANVGAAVTANSYILMGEDATKAYADGKVKAELGDDPDRTGKYTFSFTINNLTDSEETYDLSADLFTQDLFEDYVNDNDDTGLYMDTWTTSLACGAAWTVDGKPLELADELDGCDFNGDGLVNANDGQALLDYATGVRDSLTNKDKADLDGDGEINSYDSYLFFVALNTGYAVVPANGSVKVQVTLTLTNGQKEYLDTWYPKGAYIEGFVYATALSTPEGVAGTSHSIPVLGFYGNWTDPSMYDLGSFTQYYFGQETRWDYLGDWYANFVSVKDPVNGSCYFGGNPICDEAYDASRNAISVAAGASLYQAGYALIRNVAAGKLTVTNATTGEVEYEKTIGQTYSAFYDVSNGYWDYTSSKATLNFTPQGTEGDSYVLSLTMAPEYYVDAEGNVDWDALGKGATLSIPFTIDNTAPEVTDIEGDTLYIEGGDNTFTVTVKDNQYFAGAELYTSDYKYIDSYRGVDNKDGTWTVTADVSENGDGVYYLYVYDYAMNCTAYRIFNNVTESEEVEGVDLSDDYLSIMAGSSATLTATVLPATVTDNTVTWSSSDETVATVDANGVVSALSEGECTITATSNLDDTVSASCRVEVTTIDKTLNSVVTDENGDVWWNEFNTKELPNYTKLHETSAGNWFNAATLTSDGKLYASEQGYYDYTGTLYQIDPENGFEATEIGGSGWEGWACVDIADAPSLGCLLGVCGQYLICIDKETGEYDGTLTWYEYTNNLVSIAYLGTENWSGYDVDMYYLIDQEGNVYFQAIADNYYIYYNETDDYDNYDSNWTIGGFMCSTGVTAESWQYNSAYYDGEYLYWSVYGDNTSTIYAIDADNFVNAAYRMGDFGDSVWPAAGLMELGSIPDTDDNGGDDEGDDKGDDEGNDDTVIEPISLDKSLRSIIWDDDGVWWSDFNTDDLPSYQKTAASGNWFDAATLTSDGKLYASEKDWSTGAGILYEIDPENGFEATEIGSSGWDGWACADIAEAPSIEEGLIGVCGPYLICIDKETGEYNGTLTWYEYSNNLVSIAYLGTENWGGYDVDMYYLIDQEGNVYFQAIADNYYIYYNETDDYDNYDLNWMLGGYVCSTGVSTDYWSNSSAYYDGEYLYWSVCGDAASTLYAIDADDSGETYLLGDFGDNTFAMGLMEQNVTGSGTNALRGSASQTQRGSQAAKTSKAPAANASAQKPAGRVNSVVTDSDESDAGEKLDNAFTVTVTAKDADGEDIASTNGVITVTYDPEKVTLQRIIFSGACNYTSINHKDGEGSVTLGYVALGESGIAAGDAVATLVFAKLQPETETTIDLLHEETGNTLPGYLEPLTIKAVESDPDDDTPGDNTPGDDTPGDDTTGDDTPGDDTPGDDTPGDDTPGDDTPGDDTPGDDTPGDDTPGDDTTGDNTPGNNTTGDDASSTPDAPGNANAGTPSTPDAPGNANAGTPNTPDAPGITDVTTEPGSTGNKTGSDTKMGDTSQAAFWIVLAVLSLAATLFLALLPRKHRD